MKAPIFSWAKDWSQARFNYRLLHLPDVIRQAVSQPASHAGHGVYLRGAEAPLALENTT